MTAIDLGPKLDHILVRPFDLHGELAGYFVECNECGRTASAYLKAHLGADPECVAREVEKHRGCAKSEGTT